MSIRIMSTVWSLRLGDSEKIVLLALADCANDDGVCWPSMSSLAAKCSKSDRTVQAAIKTLTAAGHLSRVERPGKGVLYTVHPTPEVDAPRKDCAPKRLPPEAASPPKGTTPTPEAASDKPSRTTIHPSEASPPSDAPARRPKPRWPKDMPPPPGVSDEQWAGFIEHRKAKRNPLIPRAYDLLVAKLTAQSTDEWPPGRIIDVAVERGWLSFDMKWILRDTEQRNGTRSHHDAASGWAARPGAAGLEPASLDD